MKEKKGFLTKIYGLDCLSIFLLLLTAILNLVSLAVPEEPFYYFGLAGWIPLLICIFRTFSGNKERRWYGNLRFLEVVAPIREEAEDEVPLLEDKKNYKYYDCPECNLRIRVPKGKGRIEITCPKCDAKFIKKT